MTSSVHRVEPAPIEVKRPPVPDTQPPDTTWQQCPLPATFHDRDGRQTWANLLYQDMPRAMRGTSAIHWALTSRAEEDRFLVALLSVFATGASRWFDNTHWRIFVFPQTDVTGRISGVGALCFPHQAEASVKAPATDPVAQAMDHQALRQLYEPVVSIENAAMAGATSLLLWEHPEHGWLHGQRLQRFASSAETSAGLSTWSTVSACRAARQLNEGRLRPVPVAIEPLPMQWQHAGFARELRDLLQVSSCQAHWLDIIVPDDIDSMAMGGAQRHHDDLINLGVNLTVRAKQALPAAWLEQMPISTVRIDAEIVQGIQRSRRASALWQAWMAFAKTRRAKVIAEGVCSAEELSAVSQLGCHMTQGPVHGPARPLHRIWLATHLQP